MSKFTDAIRNLNISIQELESTNFLIPEESRFNNILKECIKLLESNNYKVRALKKIPKEIKDTRSLIDYFYFLLSIHYVGIVPFREERIDQSIAKDFVNSIKSLTGYDFDNALNMCARLVEIVFKFPEEFAFDPGTLYNFRIFGQKEMSWVTKVAINIYNRQRNDEKVLSLRADKEIEEYEKTHVIEFGFGNLEELIKINKE